MEYRTRNLEYRSDYFIILRFVILLFDIQQFELSILSRLSFAFQIRNPQSAIRNPKFYPMLHAYAALPHAAYLSRLGLPRGFS